MALFADVRLEHRLLAVDHAGVVDLMLEVRSPETAETAARPASSLAVVVDESGSMSGPKLETARRSLLWLAGRLSAHDSVALVGFDDEARLLRPFGRVDESLTAALRRLRPGGCTNLSAGLLVGLEQLSGASEGPRTLLLLSDGHANQGVTDPSVLVALVAKAAADGVVVTTIGFGEDFSEDLLRAMADSGRGNAHYIDNPDAAPAAFSEELLGLTSLVAQAVSVEIRPGAEVVQVDALNDYPATGVAGGVRIDLGDAYAGDTRRVVMRLHVPELSFLGPCPVAEIVLRYTVVSGGADSHTVRIPVAVNLVSANEAAAEAPDLAVTCEVESLLADRAREEAIRVADTGDLDSAIAILGKTAGTLRMASGLGSETVRLAQKADELGEEHELFHHFGAAARKTASYRSQRSKRSRGRGDQTDQHDQGSSS